MIIQIFVPSLLSRVPDLQNMFSKYGGKFSFKTYSTIYLTLEKEMDFSHSI